MQSQNHERSKTSSCLKEKKKIWRIKCETMTLSSLKDVFDKLKK